MDMADLPLANTKFNATKTMPLYRDSLPCADNIGDALAAILRNALLLCNDKLTYSM